MTRRTYPSFLGACFLPAVALLLLAMLAAGAFVLTVPAQAAQHFGPPTAGLSAVQRYTLSATLLLQAGDLEKPFDPNGAPQVFRVETGESVASIAQRLHQQALIPDAGAFRAYLQYSGLDTAIQAGDYTLSPALSPIELAHSLRSAISASVPFHVLPGWRVEEIAAALPTSGLNIAPEDFLAAARAHPSNYGFSLELPASAGSEGFLYPGLYDLPRETDAAGLVSLLLGQFFASVEPGIGEGLAQQGLTLPEGVILASIIEREAVLDEEMPMIASVFYNRLAIGMKLDSDPTVQYALGYNAAQQTWWTNPLSAADLQMISAYNTYQQAGLPPAPICNPGASALSAAAYPAQTPYYYFRAACDGSGRHVFATTYEEHLANGCP